MFQTNPYAIMAVFAQSFVSAGSAALALEPGYCAPPNVVQQQLQEEGLIPLAAMNRLQANVEKQDSELVAQFIMSTSDFSRWIVIKADEPIGTRASEICVSLQGRDLEVNDNRREELLPGVAEYTFDVEQAQAQCDRINSRVEGSTACNERNIALNYFDTELGEKLAFQGIQVGVDGQDGGIWTLVADPVEQDFRTLATFNQGATIVSGRGDDFAYAPALIDHLDGSR